MKILEIAIGKAWALVFLAGIFFILLAFYRFSGSLFSPSVTSGPLAMPLLVLGVVALAASGAIYLIEKDVLWTRTGPRIGRSAHGIEASYRGCTISVDFGRIEALAAACPDRCAVVLPINNHFEDRCFEDRKIALGSYLAAHFSHSEVTAVREAVTAKLKGLAESGMISGPPYPVGSAVYVEQLHHRMIIAAVSTKQTAEGVKSEIAFLHNAMREIMARIVEEEIGVLYLPVIGAGKGGIPAHVALLSLINAVCESVNRASGHHLRSAHVVVLTKEKQRLQLRDARRIMRVCLALWADQPRAA